MTGLHISHNLPEDSCFPLTVALYLRVLGLKISVDSTGGDFIDFHSLLGTDHCFHHWGIMISRRQEIFLLTLTCRQFFLKFPTIPITRVASTNNSFSDASLGQTIYFSNFLHTDNFFPNRDTPWENNGPSLRYRGGGGAVCFLVGSIMRSISI